MHDTPVDTSSCKNTNFCISADNKPCQSQSTAAHASPTTTGTKQQWENTVQQSLLFHLNNTWVSPEWSMRMSDRGGFFINPPLSFIHLFIYLFTLFFTGNMNTIYVPGKINAVYMQNSKTVEGLLLFLFLVWSHCEWFELRDVNRPWSKSFSGILFLTIQCLKGQNVECKQVTGNFLKFRSEPGCD